MTNGSLRIGNPDAHRRVALALLALITAGLPLYSQAQAPRAEGEPPLLDPKQMMNPKPDPAVLRAARAVPTPRTADGRPDLSGYWPVQIPCNPFLPCKSPIEPGAKNVVLDLPPVQAANAGDKVNVSRRIADPNSRPLYKTAEDTKKAQDNFVHADYKDPAYGCGAPGLARLGAPQEIVQTKTTLYFLYANQNRYRVVPIDGRKHDEELESTTNGDSVGHWEGDTLMIDTVNVSSDTWLDRDGSFHSSKLHVVEHLKRSGNSLSYDIQMDDPIFQKPFAPDEQIRVLGKPGEHVAEDYPCSEKSREHLVTTDRH